MSETPINPDTAPHWSALAEGRFEVPWCAVCDTFVWLPRSHCVRCLTPVAEWRELAGTGEVYTFTTVHRGAAGFAEPYVLAYVNLDGGPTIMANLHYPPDREPAIGDRVALVPGEAARFAPSPTVALS